MLHDFKAPLYIYPVFNLTTCCEPAEAIIIVPIAQMVKLRHRSQTICPKITQLVMILCLLILKTTLFYRKGNWDQRGGLYITHLEKLQALWPTQVRAVTLLSKPLLSVLHPTTFHTARAKCPVPNQSLIWLGRGLRQGRVHVKDLGLKQWNCTREQCWVRRSDWIKCWFRSKLLSEPPGLHGGTLSFPYCHPWFLNPAPTTLFHIAQTHYSPLSSIFLPLSLYPVPVPWAAGAVCDENDCQRPKI